MDDTHVPVVPGSDALQIGHHVALLLAPYLVHILVGTHIDALNSALITKIILYNG